MREYIIYIHTYVTGSAKTRHVRIMAVDFQFLHKTQAEKMILLGTKFHSDIQLFRRDIRGIVYNSLSD